jgi:AraC-like DNA-binding protein
VPVLERQVAESFEVNRNAELREIRLADAVLRSKSPDEGIGESLKTEVSFKPGASEAAQDKLRLAVVFGFRIFEEADGNSIDLVNVDCQMVAEYALRPGYHPAESHIRAFHHANAVFNCWPFFREYIQSSIVRMGYPPPPVPFLRLLQRREEEDKNASAHRKRKRLKKI